MFEGAAALQADETPDSGGRTRGRSRALPGDLANAKRRLENLPRERAGAAHIPGPARGDGGFDDEAPLACPQRAELPAAQRGILKGSMACTQGWRKRCSDRLSCTATVPSSRSRNKERL